MERKVVKIDIDEKCIETYPCHHKCVFHYNDNTQLNTCISGATIIQKFNEFLTDSDKKHFMYYINWGK